MALNAENLMSLKGRIVNFTYVDDERQVEIVIEDVANQPRPDGIAIGDACCLEEIDRIPRLRLSLREWEKNFQIGRDRIERKWTRSNNVKNELYQLIGFYSVFQGVVLTAVAQAQPLKCHTSWGPALLSLIASLAALAGVRNKLLYYSELKKLAKKEEEDSKALNEKINDMKDSGKDFDFSKYDKMKQKYATFEGLQNRYYYGVLGLLVIFSAIVLGCCFSILCWQ